MNKKVRNLIIVFSAIGFIFILSIAGFYFLIHSLGPQKYFSSFEILDDVYELPNSSDFHLTGSFGFTISPNDKYLFYINNEGNSVIYYLEREEKITLVDPLPKGYVNYNYFDLASKACWTPDSLYCVPFYYGDDPLEIEEFNYIENFPEVFIKIPPEEEPSLILNLLGRYSEEEIEKASLKQERFGGKNYTEISPEGFTCSECVMIEENLKNFFNEKIGSSSHENCLFYQPKLKYCSVSPDKNKIYYSKYEDEYGSKPKVYLIQKDIDSSEEKEIISFKGTSIGLQQLSPSPDGNLLAFTFSKSGGIPSYGSSFLLITNLESGETFFVPLEGGAFHLRWASDSEKLFFTNNGSIKFLQMEK